jgi:hypothetical protein
LLRASDRLVRLRHHADNVVFRVQQSFQRRHADLASADEDDAHAELLRQLMHGPATRTLPRYRLREYFLSGRDLTPAYRRSAPGAKIIEDLTVGQN